MRLYVARVLGTQRDEGVGDIEIRGFKGQRERMMWSTQRDEGVRDEDEGVGDEDEGVWDTDRGVGNKDEGV